jgi:hypothetical protein
MTPPIYLLYRNAYDSHYMQCNAIQVQKVIPTLFISLTYIGQMKMFHVTHTLHLQFNRERNRERCCRSNMLAMW